MALNPKLTHWQGRVVWLVGASTGIGRALAELLHAKGAAVIVSARSARTLERFVAAHPGSRALPLDVAEPHALADAAASIVARHGRIDHVVYCAGTYRAMRATAFDLDSALQHLRINYEGALRLLDAVLPQLLRQAAGNAFNWRYTLKLPVDGSVYEVQFDDWMYLMDERVMLNKAVMSKFGITLGEVTLSFYRK